MVEQNSTTDNWMNELTSKTAILKILDGEDARFMFQDEGLKKDHADYGKSIAFNVRVQKMTKIVDGDKFVKVPKTEEAVKTFYVRANNFDLLGQIKELAKQNNGILTGLTVDMFRKGKLRSDTRYTIKKAEDGKPAEQSAAV